MILRDLELGAIQAHILYHATIEPIYGSWMAGELAHHGYTISYGTLYPMLHRMQQEGLLVCEERREGSQMRKYYRATEQGVRELEQIRHRIRELYQELVLEKPGALSEHPSPRYGDA
ncbi:PadR family transcriptional regulator [Dictyobacter sp. S3.2.2.5]|uniref:PadR family transcriptional regulator n=1 Tax=Dictyobacter halimunensis TaxID=3026934 RepID=A0ABQ6FT24_9CHLR|nr:PadR family transcriptional regulator [Dictyobacter sp. S3.2.2.5]